MKLLVLFDIKKWEEFEDRWEFKRNNGARNTILVEEDISFMAFLDKIYAKIWLARDMFELPLSFLPRMDQKSNLIFIKTDDDVASIQGWDDLQTLFTSYHHS